MTPAKLNYTTTFTNIHNTLAHELRTPAAIQNARKRFGPCQIDVPYKGIFGIIIDDVISPFYIFQVRVWM